MPKKFKGENSKAVEARARIESKKKDEKEQIDREKEDELWKEDDKHVLKKQQRKGDKEKKKQEQLDKKQELKQLYDEEQSQLKSTKSSQPAKITRAEIEAQQEREAAEAHTATAKASRVTEQPLEENVNIAQVDGDEARSVEDAIAILSVKDAEYDKHPEKRVKAAFKKYEEENLPILKAENPNMRLSQLKQMLKKDWMKSPENPLNQQH